MFYEAITLVIFSEVLGQTSEYTIGPRTWPWR
jgi:hypothetical protein